MKKIFGALIALYSAFALSATTVPVQLLNPTGSSSGQPIVSTGASSAPAWGGIGVNGIAAIAANTVLANATASSASPTAFAIPSCSATGNALAYTSGTGFTCNTALFSSPTITTPTITGVTNGGNANAGSVGEFQCAQVTLTAQSNPQGCTVNSGTPINLTTGTPVNVTSLTLTAGDWDVSGVVGFVPAAGTTVTFQLGWIGTASATIPTISGNLGAIWQLAGITSAAGAASNIFSVGTVRVSVASTTTVYLQADSNFSGSTQTAYGFLAARRRR